MQLLVRPLKHWTQEMERLWPWLICSNFKYDPLGDKKMKRIIALLVLVTSVSAVANYEIRWHTIDGGGGTSSGGQYVVMGTIGQHDAAYSYSDDYELLGGFGRANRCV